MRVFAGPNGSGKTTIFEGVSDRFFTGIYVNADRIESEIAETGAVDLRAFKITQGVSGIRDTLQQMVPQWEGAGKQAAAALGVSRGPIVRVDTQDSQYEAAVVADLIRRCLFVEGEYFAFETVMSHQSKIDFMRVATADGYKCYLYFICTDDPRINVERIKARVEAGGHGVPTRKVRERYHRSLDLLASAVQVAYRSFLFDNTDDPTDDVSLAYVEYERGVLKHVPEKERISRWMRQYAPGLRP